MQHSQTAAADETAAPRMDRWGLAFLRFVADFWLLFVFGLLLGLVFIWLPQSKEVWRHYVLSPLPGAREVGWAVLHALFAVAALVFSGVVFSRYAHHKALLRQRRGRSPALWVVACAALLPIMLVLAGVACAAVEYLDVGAVTTRMIAAASIAGVLLLLALLAVVVLARTGGAAALAQLIGRRRTGLLTALVGLALLALFLVLPWLQVPVFIGVAQAVGVAPIMLFSFGLVLYAIDAAFRATGYRKPLALAALAVVAAGILFGDLATAHRVRRAGAVEKNLPDVGSEFLRWLETRKDLDKYQNGYPVFIVAAQGGGLYAAYHTARVLAVLQDECPAFAQHVFAISGVSGGSLGAAVFASAVDSISPDQTSEPCRDPGRSTQFVEYTDRFLERDFLSPLGFLAVIPNIAQRVAGLPFTLVEMAPRGVRKELRSRLRGIARYDRARGLEHGFEQAWRDASRSPGKPVNFFEAPSTRVWSGKDAVPAVIFNSARADTGITYAVAPFRLDKETHLDFRAKVLGVEAPRWDVPVSTGVGLSARYPFATGPGMITVRGRKWLEKDDSPVETVGLVDGGFVENSGLATVGKLVREIHDAVVMEGKRKVSVHVIAIQDLSAFTYSHSGVEESGQKRIFLPEDMRDLVEKKDFDRPVRLGFAELTGPLTALDASRSARGFYTLNALVENVATLRCAQGIGAKDTPCTASGTSRSGEVVDVAPVGHALFGVTANNHALPLAWQLSSLSRTRIADRTWTGTHAHWSCNKRLAIPMSGSKYQPLDKSDQDELRRLGEDLGGFVDRWISACGREHIHNVLEPKKGSSS